MTEVQRKERKTRPIVAETRAVVETSAAAPPAVRGFEPVAPRAAIACSPDVTPIAVCYPRAAYARHSTTSVGHFGAAASGT
jgi:hypothetical protein